jgi:GAF domain-containing protein/HAMP domain-containing protein
MTERESHMFKKIFPPIENESNQSPQDPGYINIQRAFWVSIIFTAVAVISMGLGIYLVFNYPYWQIYAILIIAALSSVFDVLAVVLIRRGRAGISLKILYWSGLITLPLNSLLVPGIAPVLVAIVMVMGFVNIYLLFPRTWRKFALIGPITAALFMLLVDYLNPPFRYSVGVLPTSNFYGPFILVFLVVGILFLIIRQAIQGNIRTKLIISFVLVAVIAAWSVVFFADRSSRTTLTNSIGNNLSSLSSGQAIQVGQTLQSELDKLNTLALTSAVQQRAESGTAANTLGSYKIQVLDKQWRAADAANNNADPLVASVLNDPLTAELLKFQAKYPENVEIFLTDLPGVSLATTDRTSDYLQSDEEWWQAAYKNGQYIGQPEFDASSKTLAINMAVVVRAPGSNRIVGVLRTTVNINSLGNVLNAGLFGKTGQTTIYLPDGQEIKLVPNSVGEYELSVEKANLDINALIQSNARYQITSIDNVPNLVSFSGVLVLGNNEESSLIKNLGWYVVTRQDQSEALKPVTTQTQNNLILAAVIAILAALAAFVLAQLLAGPIVRLNAIAEKVAAGDLAIQAKVETSDEIGTLANTFNNMVTRLRTLIGTLEQRVAERTQSLELAADVGRSVSQVRALDVMLKDAAEIIRARFDLYYTQVYLTNPSQTELVLQAGTGTVGAELLGRNHRLAFNTASINGRAAVEKHSVVISDTTTSATFRPNPLLPDTRSEMAVPLMVGEKVVGVLDLQSRNAGALSEDLLPAFEALAGQLAIAIQNASLLAEAEQARADVETQARRLVRANWQDYLDAIHKPEHTGFMFEQNQIKPIDATSETSSKHAVSAPIAVTGESIGSLVVELDAEKQTAKNVELVNTIARQVSQQIENLRLLESAERYRHESEQAMHRITREGWKTYMESGSGKLGYMYDLKEVLPVEPDYTASDNAVTLPINVRDEAVGKIALTGFDQNDSQSLELANAVAERLGAHIESLRQFDQTQSALAQTEKLSDASLRFAQATDLQEVVKIAVETLDIAKINRAVLGVFTYNSANELESMEVAANWWNGSGHQVTSIGTRYMADTLRVLSMFVSPTPVFSTDTFDDPRIDASGLEVVKRTNIRSMAALPLYLGSRQVGTLLLEAEEPHTFTENETKLFSAMGPQIATVLENRRQYAQAQKQAERESTLNIISQKIQSATTVEAVLQIAARELGHALGAPLTIAQLGIKEK